MCGHKPVPRKLIECERKNNFSLIYNIRVSNCNRSVYVLLLPLLQILLLFAVINEVCVCAFVGACVCVLSEHVCERIDCLAHFKRDNLHNHPYARPDRTCCRAPIYIRITQVSVGGLCVRLGLCACVCVCGTAYE